MKETLKENVFPFYIFKEPRKTFMEILKVNNREVPFVNLLAFFFKPHEKHGLGDKFIKALLETNCSELAFQNQGIKENPLKSNGIGYDIIENIIGEKVKVIVEQPTSKNSSKSDLNKKRIDILIVAQNFVICIEFKINHALNNPLEDYKKFISENYSEKRKYYVLLTPYNKKCIGNAKKSTEFKQVILSHFIDKIKENLPENYKTDYTENHYYEYFKDFIQTVENRKIKSARHLFFETLNQEINSQKINSKFHIQKNGFLEIKKNGNILKLRFFINSKSNDIEKHNIGWQLEKWNNGKKVETEFLNKEKSYQKIIERIKFTLQT